MVDQKQGGRECPDVLVLIFERQIRFIFKLSCHSTQNLLALCWIDLSGFRSLNAIESERLSSPRVHTSA